MHSQILLLPLLFTNALSLSIRDAPTNSNSNSTSDIQLPTGNAFSALPNEVLITALTETDEFSVSCIFSCGAVLGAAACIGIAIEEGNTGIAAKCLKGGAGKLCPCAKCVPGLKGFVTKHHLC